MLPAFKAYQTSYGFSMRPEPRPELSQWDASNGKVGFKNIP